MAIDPALAAFLLNGGMRPRMPKPQLGGKSVPAFNSETMAAIMRANERAKAQQAQRPAPVENDMAARRAWLEATQPTADAAPQMPTPEQQEELAARQAGLEAFPLAGEKSRQMDPVLQGEMAKRIDKQTAERLATNRLTDPASGGRETIAPDRSAAIAELESETPEQRRDRGIRTADEAHAAGLYRNDDEYLADVKKYLDEYEAVASAGRFSR